MTENGPQSPPGDDLTDLGQSEVFDDSIMSDGRKISGDSINREKKSSLEGKMHKKKTSRDSMRDVKVEKKPLSREKSNSLPKTPKIHTKSKHFNFPECSSPNQAVEEPIFPHRDSKKLKSSKQPYESPEKSANKEFIYKDFTKKDGKPSTPSLKHKQRKQHKDTKDLDDTKRKQSPKQSFEPLTGKESFPIALEKIKVKSRSGSEKGPKSFESPSRKKRLEVV